MCTESRFRGVRGFVAALIITLMLVSEPPFALATPVPPPNLPDIVEGTLPGVVNISSTVVGPTEIFGMNDFLRFWGIPQERKQTTLGSGFILDSDGYLITNNHVVEQADEVMVTLLDKRQFIARIVGKDPKLDVALLQLRDKDRKAPKDLRPSKTGNSDTVRIAEPVFAVGNPFGLQHTVTMGIISAKNRTIGLGPLDNFLQTDASINPGNSGGPLFNLKGEVIGVNTVIYSRTGQSGGLGFAIPMNEVLRILADLKQYGRVPRPWLGILAERVTPQVAAYYQLPVKQGVLIYNLVEAAPAMRAGVRRGDILVSLQGEKLDDPYDLEKFLFRHKPKEEITIEVQRGAKRMTVRLKLEELPPRIQQLPQGII